MASLWLASPVSLIGSTSFVQVVNIRKDRRTGLLQVDPKSLQALASQSAHQVSSNDVHLSTLAALKAASSASSNSKLLSTKPLRNSAADAAAAAASIVDSLMTQHGRPAGESGDAAALKAVDAAGDGERLMAEAVQMTQMQTLPTDVESYATTAACVEDPDVWFEVSNPLPYDGSSFDGHFLTESGATATRFSLDCG